MITNLCVDLRFQLYIEPAAGPRLTWCAGCAGEVELVIDQDVGGQTPLHESLDVGLDLVPQID